MRTPDDFLDEVDRLTDLNEIEAIQNRQAFDRADRVSPRRPLDPSQDFTWDIPDNDESDFDHE